MLHHFDCAPTSGNPKAQSLVFDWDDETGEISGRDVAHVHECFEGKTISAHPMPCSWTLTSPKNRTDIAAIVGRHWHLPPELADFYPELGDDWDGVIRDEAGNVIGHAQF
ncbi:MAG: hypothetical protein LBD67_09935 [Candidatus Accumulibacter sp.]|nr:hypothetical protein [Accumulibacter sp.]